MDIKIEFKIDVKQKRTVHFQVVAFKVTVLIGVKVKNNCRKPINLV